MGGSDESEMEALKSKLQESKDVFHAFMARAKSHAEVIEGKLFDFEEKSQKLQNSRKCLEGKLGAKNSYGSFGREAYQV